MEIRYVPLLEKHSTKINQEAHACDIKCTFLDMIEENVCYFRYTAPKGRYFWHFRYYANISKIIGLWADSITDRENRKILNHAKKYGIQTHGWVTTALNSWIIEFWMPHKMRDCVIKYFDDQVKLWDRDACIPINEGDLSEDLSKRLDTYFEGNASIEQVFESALFTQYSLELFLIISNALDNSAPLHHRLQAAKLIQHLGWPIFSFGINMIFSERDIHSIPTELEKILLSIQSQMLETYPIIRDEYFCKNIDAHTSYKERRRNQ